MSTSTPSHKATTGTTTDGKVPAGSSPEGRSTEPATTPPAATGATRQPDNTAVNKRDASGAPLTPMDQSNAKSDIDITAEIRRSLVGDSALSMTAKNIKVITVKGKVTLRGPVNSTEERARIDAAARRVAGDAQVDNQLEVKTK